MMPRKLGIFLRKALLLPHQEIFLSKDLEIVIRNEGAWSAENGKLNRLYHSAFFIQSN